MTERPAASEAPPQPQADDTLVAPAAVGETVVVPAGGAVDDTLVAPAAAEETVVVPAGGGVDDTLVAPAAADETAVVPRGGPADDTLVAPAAVDNTVVVPAPEAAVTAPRWSGRAPVPPPRRPATELDDGSWVSGEVPGEPPSGPWWLPAALGLLALVILAVLGVGVWLIADSVRD
ncbi:MAG: hypothetical protein FWJ87_06620, partial [Micromonosporaceae bacterium]